MADQRRAAESPNPRVQAALRTYLERIDRGELVDRERFLAEHADVADDLRSFLDAEAALAAAAPGAAAADVSTHSVAQRGEETLIPQRVQEAERQSNKSALPPQFGRYRILKPLGSGAMGTVYLAEDTQLERQVALKTPSFEQDETGELLQRFYREARSAAKIHHPHICPVYDVGEIEGRHVISMAYIEGRPLSAFIQPDKPQTERNILVVVRKLALALQEAHNHGIIHRDLKPGNVMINQRGEPIIMDFGLARHVQKDAESRLTQSGMIVGSPAYMSPEQVEGIPDKLTPAADQYSLGVILYELLTGKLPFRGGITAVIGAILTKSPLPVEQLRPGLDPRISAMCARMMHKRAAERYPSLKAVADDIATILRDDRSPSTAPAAGLVPTDTGAPGTSKPTPASPTPASKPKSPPPARTSKPAAATTGGPTVAAASITESNVASLYEAAQKCMRKYDYEQVVQMLEQVPQQKRSPDVLALLAKARQLSDEVAFLVAEIDEAVRLNDNEAIARKADELLKLKPKHHKALQLKEELSRYGKGRLWKAGGYTPDGRRIGEGSWIPWIGIVVGLVVFGLTTWAVTVYLRSGSAVVRVQINDPNIKFTLQDEEITIDDNGKELRISPEDENTLRITYGEIEFISDKKFALNKGENPAIIVEIVDEELVAKIGEELLGEWKVEPLIAEVTEPGAVLESVGSPGTELEFAL